jgi:hypothetical protein
VLRGNVVIGARELGVPAGERNVSLSSRKAAGLPPYPQVDPAMIEQALRLR